LRRVCLRIPALFPLALFLWVPGIIQLAEVAYAVVSRHRHAISGLFGCRGACDVLPAKQRTGDVFTEQH